MNKVLIMLIVILLSSCTAKKSTYEFKQDLKYDSIKYISEKITYPSIKDTVYVDSPCDSLGNLKPFKQTFTTNQGKIVIEGKNNRITSSINLKETSVSTINDTKIHKENISIKKNEYKKVRVQDWRIILMLIISFFLNVYFIFTNFIKKVS